MGSEASRVHSQDNLRADDLRLTQSRDASGVASQQTSTDPAFPVELLSVLVALAGDSVTLQGCQANPLQPIDVLTRSLETFINIRNAVNRSPGVNIADSATQEPMSSGNAFNLEFIQVFEGLLAQNIDLAIRCQADLNVLNMSKPSFIRQLAQWLRRAMESHIRRDQELESCTKARAVAERSLRTIAEEKEKLADLIAQCQEAIKRWEANTGITLGGDHLNESIYALLSTLESPLQSNDAMAQERDRRIGELETECLAQKRNAEQFKLMSEQALQAVADAKQTVLALQLDPSSSYTTATVFQVGRNGDMSSIDFSSISTMQIPLAPPSRKRSFAVAEGASGEEEDDPLSKPWIMALDLAAHGTPPPSDRALAVAQYADVPIDLPPEFDYPVVFSRDSIAVILGGNWKLHHVLLGLTATKLANDYRITKYSMSTMERNPWSPAGPGKHGYWFLPVREMKVPFELNEERHVFMGTVKEGAYHYCGYYRLVEFGTLTLDEWSSLPYLHKIEYARSICPAPEDLKHYHSSSIDDLIRKLDRGVYTIPYVQLQCVRFDVKFYAELSRENDKFFEEGFDLCLQPAKRRRIESEEPEYESEEHQDE